MSSKPTIALRTLPSLQSSNSPIAASVEIPLVPSSVNDYSSTALEESVGSELDIR